MAESYADISSIIKYGVNWRKWDFVQRNLLFYMKTIKQQYYSQIILVII